MQDDQRSVEAAATSRVEPTKYHPAYQRADSPASLFGAILLGGLLGAIGALVDGLVTISLGIRFFLNPLLIGFGVGWGVWVGSKRRGGWVYQAIAVGLAYLAIAAGHLPMMPAGAEQVSPVEMLALLLVMPIYRGINGVVGLAMILLGLFQAWRLNRRPRAVAKVGR